ncbi:MAG: copper resistance system multicopper oxidase [Proteobacteria bacterium]|nr:copper resistance system multicopper oxidase [Pseudomonadota bacterium]
MKSNSISRRTLLKGIGAIGTLKGLESILPSYVWANMLNVAIQPPEISGNVINLTIAETPFHVDNLNATAITVNGTVPGPLIRLQEGQNVTLKVTNHLKEASSIHWHGILLPPDMDGVPGVSFAGIEPGTTFVYQFPVKQSGTYWYHSHSGGQEQSGVYAPMIIDPIEPDPIQYDREYVVMLSDWSFESAEQMIAKLKKQSDYFNYQQRTLGEFFLDLKQKGWSATFDNYLAWARMRMDPTDLGDVTSHAYTYLMNGLSPATNWTGLFNPGERVRLRFIQVGVMTFQDVRIPGLKMTVVQADGQNVQPIEVDEFRLGPAETYDVIVEPTEERAYTIFAETMDRSGYARGTLAPRPGMSASVPQRRPRPLRTMEDMGMDMSGMQMDNMEANAEHKSMHIHGMDMKIENPKLPSVEHHIPGMHNMEQMSAQVNRSEIPGSTPVKHGPDDHGTGNQVVPDSTRSRLDEPGIGLGEDGRRVLVYTDLKSLHPYPDQRKPERELELHLTGNMERYMWSFDGKKYSDAKEPVHFNYGERLRWTFVNDTMMEHTMHLHGMWMHLENGAGEYLPRKHTVLVKPAERVSVAITADAPGRWAFHCHLLLHMDVGMFRVVEVSDVVPHA